MNIGEYKEMNIEEFKEQCRIEFVQDQNEEISLEPVTNTSQTNEPITEDRNDMDEKFKEKTGKRGKYKIFTQKEKERFLQEVSLFKILLLS